MEIMVMMIGMMMMVVMVMMMRIKENATCAFFPTSFRGSTLRIRTFTTVTQSFDTIKIVIFIIQIVSWSQSYLDHDRYEIVNGYFADFVL